MKTKQSRPAPAKDLYVSPLFVGRRRFVEQTCDRWFILSAKHGLVEPDAVLEPYEQSLKGVSASARRLWSTRVLNELQRALGPLRDYEFEIHAGTEYRAFGLEDGIRKLGGTAKVPTSGMSLGRQLAFYQH